VSSRITQASRDSDCTQGCGIWCQCPNGPFVRTSVAIRPYPRC